MNVGCCFKFAQIFSWMPVSQKLIIVNSYICWFTPRGPVCRIWLQVNLTLINHFLPLLCQCRLLWNKRHKWLPLKIDSNRISISTDRRVYSWGWKRLYIDFLYELKSTRRARVTWCRNSSNKISVEGIWFRLQCGHPALWSRGFWHALPCGMSGMEQ